jgi:hypothetical protein
MTTTNAKRITKTDRFNEIKALLADRADLVEFIDHEIELIANKNKSVGGEKKLTATQVANNSIKAEILSTMEVGERYTCAELIKLVPSLNDASTSKVSSLLRQMRTDVEGASGEIVRTEEKGKTYFALA